MKSKISEALIAGAIIALLLVTIAIHMIFFS